MSLIDTTTEELIKAANAKYGIRGFGGWLDGLKRAALEYAKAWRLANDIYNQPINYDTPQQSVAETDKDRIVKAAFEFVEAELALRNSKFNIDIAQEAKSKATELCKVIQEFNKNEFNKWTNDDMSKINNMIHWGKK